MEGYEHFSKGDVVRVVAGPRAGATGTVEVMTNAGSEGLVYDLRTDDGSWVCGVYAGSLEAVSVVEPPVPWHGQHTWRNGVRIDGAWD